MSRRQWGHGFHTGFSEGYQRAKMDAETQRIFKNNPDAHWVPVREFCSDGLMPTVPLLCGLKDESFSGDRSCVGGSGSNCCAGFCGTNWNGTHAICLLSIPAQSADAV
ncbi:MAG: hypothetical protein EOM91_12445 [Sphingobacteriia bacterium]|nr:hypothetical protein [Sphingobacteriia bacterium]